MQRFLAALLMLCAQSSYANEVNSLTIDNSLTLQYATPLRVLTTDSGSNVISQTTLSGNTSEIATASGSLTNGHCVQIDSHGNFVDAGAACGTGSGAVWGSITGTLSNQTDLQNALNAKQNSLTIGNLTDSGTDGISVSNGTGAVIGSGTALSQHVAGASNNGYLSSTDWTTFNGKQSALTLGNLTDSGTDGITVTGGTGAVVGSGVSLSQHVAGASNSGYLSSTDWNTFNGKQAAGSYITALTGDVTASGPGSVAATLATVNSNVGSFGSNTGIPSFTVNGKGLITAASNNAVVTAPAASTVAAWDANKNLSANSFLEGYATTVLAGGTTTLSVASREQQYFTGGSSQNVVLPVASTLTLGQLFLIVNNATGTVTVKSSGGNTVVTLAAGQYALVTVILTSGTTAASWSVQTGLSSGAYLPLTGGTMTGTLNMNSNGISNPSVISNAGAYSMANGSSISEDSGGQLELSSGSSVEGVVIQGSAYAIAQFTDPGASPYIDFFGPLDMHSHTIAGIGYLENASGGTLSDNGSAGWNGPNGFTLIDASNSLYYGNGENMTAYGNHLLWPTDGSDLTDGTNLYIDANSGGFLGFDEYNSGATMQSDGSGGINYGGAVGLVAHLGYDGANLTTWSLGTGNGFSFTPAYFQADNSGSVSVNTDPSSSSSVINLAVGGVLAGQFNSSGLTLPLQSASKVLITDVSSNVATSSVTSTQLGLIVNGRGSSTWPLSTGTLSAVVTNEIVGGGKTGQAMTLRSATVAADSFTCSVNPTINLLDCGTSAGACTSGTTTLATCSLTAKNTLTACTINSSSVSSGHFWAWEVTAGTCTTLNASGSAELGSALQ